jgi:hypothetical protein
LRAPVRVQQARRGDAEAGIRRGCDGRGSASWSASAAVQQQQDVPARRRPPRRRREPVPSCRTTRTAGTGRRRRGRCRRGCRRAASFPRAPLDAERQRISSRVSWVETDEVGAPTALSAPARAAGPQHDEDVGQERVVPHA